MSGLVWNCPASPMVKTGPFHCHGLASVSAGEVRSCKPERCGQKKKKCLHTHWMAAAAAAAAAPAKWLMAAIHPLKKKNGTSENKFSCKYRELEPLYALGKNVKWCSHYGKQYKCLWKLKIELPYGPAIPPLGVNPKQLEAGCWRTICTPVSIVALLMIGKKWKQPKRSWMDDRINQVCRLHTIEYYLAFK